MLIKQYDSLKTDSERGTLRLAQKPFPLGLALVSRCRNPPGISNILIIHVLNTYGVDDWMQSGVARSQQSRWFAEKAVATGTVDWDAISNIVQSDNGKRELASLKNTMMELERAVGTASQTVAEPDWATYKSQLDASIVDKFEKAYKSMKIPEYEDKEIKNVAERFKAIVDQAEKISAESKKRVEAIMIELEQIDKQKKQLKTATIDEELAKDPELAKKIDETNEKNSFLVS